MNEDSDFPSRRAQAEAFYGPLKTQKTAAARVGWESPHAHRVRMAAAIAAAGPLADYRSVIDAGCGEGALLPHLRGAGFDGDYRGEDALHWMVNAARQQHRADTRADFVLADAFDPTGPSADLVICSGALNTKVDGADPEHLFATSLEALWSRTRLVLVIDVAITDRHAPGQRLATVDAAKAFSAGRALSRAFVWREDGVFGEAQLVLWRDRRRPIEALNAGLEATAVADLLLQARESEAAKTALADERGPHPKLLRGIADAQLGRLRDAEASLRVLLGTTVGGTAALHLAAILRGTRRHREAEALLASAATGDSREADEARLMLATMLAAREPDAARRWASAIGDPFIRREGLRVVDEA